MRWKRTEEDGICCYTNEQGDVLKRIDVSHGDTYAFYTTVDGKKCIFTIRTEEFDINSALDQAVELLDKIAE